MYCIYSILSWYSSNYLILTIWRADIYFDLSDEGPMLETLDHTIRIGSTPTFLYYDN